jgi:hypothetical protein
MEEEIRVEKALAGSYQKDLQQVWYSAHKKTYRPNQKKKFLLHQLPATVCCKRPVIFNY